MCSAPSCWSPRYRPSRRCTSGGFSTNYSRAELALVGILWTVLTIGFEFLVGYVEGTPVSVTLGQCDVLAGQVWVAVPVTLLVSPLVFGWYPDR